MGLLRFEMAVLHFHGENLILEHRLGPFLLLVEALCDFPLSFLLEEGVTLFLPGQVISQIILKAHRFFLQFLKLALDGSSQRGAFNLLVGYVLNIEDVTVNPKLVAQTPIIVKKLLLCA